MQSGVIHNKKKQMIVLNSTCVPESEQKKVTPDVEDHSLSDSLFHELAKHEGRQLTPQSNSGQLKQEAADTWN